VKFVAVGSEDVEGRRKRRKKRREKRRKEGVEERLGRGGEGMGWEGRGRGGKGRTYCDAKSSRQARDHPKDSQSH
jgi:hypothetical protein